MPDAPDSTNKIVPPFSPFRAQIESPDKRRRERAPKKQQKKEREKDGEKGDRGKAVDVLI
ncbi:MAG: hypothetical protein JRF49_00375 [Deltaproteobacteria bacterium]|nr:hypothetical protein [Deltaproteobacteria bacterium]MBW2182306.1 hypothetical protein [Deltaproteobacteria bacterium]